MRAVVVRGLRQVAVDTVEDARIEAPTDALLRVTSTAICGTDLHIYDGRMGDVAGMIIGHEPLGIVEEVGPAVATVRRGDRVTVPTHICCGFCYNCVRGYTDACLTTHPGAAGAAYGYPGMGPHVAQMPNWCVCPSPMPRSTTSCSSQTPSPPAITPPRLRGSCQATV
jgi:glutathione-independent formaldehyde dehydrogenase